MPFLRGRYRPIKPIGRGGFGRTYLAMDTDRLDSYCVIKQFAPQAQGTKSLNKAVQLFNQEALRLHELGEHPQIPTLMAYFEQDRYLYLVQQMINGRTVLQEMQKEGPFNEAKIRDVLLDMLSTLQYVHAHMVIHRDITPSNIIRRKADGKLVLIDFGVAKQFSEALQNEPGTRIGTEGYAPIEQLRGGQAYPASDLYSLGATCLHLMTGCKPERLYSPLEGRWLWRDYIQKMGVKIDPKLGEVLDRLVRDLLSERYQSATEVLQDLQALPSIQGSVPGWIRQHPVEGSSLSSPPLNLSNPSGPISAPRSPSTPPNLSQPPSSPSRPPSAPPASAPPQGHRTPAQRTSRPPVSEGNRAKSWRCVRTFTGHSSWVTSLAISPNTPTLVSGSLDDSIRIWNLQTGAVLSVLSGHPRGVNGVTISSAGQVMASCGDDDLVRVWNLASGTLLHTLKGHTRDVNAIAIGSSGWLLASGSEDRSIKLWKLDKGTLLSTLAGAPGIIKSLAISPDERWLVSGGLDNKVRLWDIQKAQMVRALSGHFNSVNGVAVSPDGQLIASASKDRTVRLWDARTGALVHSLSDHSQEVNAVAISPDNRTIVSASSDSNIKVWDGKTGTLTHTLSGHTSSVLALTIHRSGQLIASASADKTIKLWQWI